MKPNWFIALPIRLLADPLADAPHPPQGVRPFPIEDLHLTVAFLGGVTREAALAAWELAPGWTGGSILATFGPVVPMGNPRRPSALSALLDEGNREVVELIRLLRDPMLERAGAPPDRRAPQPHITLARPGRNAGSETRRAAVQWAARLHLPPVPFALDQLALYTWHSDRPRRLFEVVASLPLGPSSVEG